MDIIEYINKVPQLKQLVHYHNINTQGVPQNYRNKINRVPTMLTKNGKILVGNEIKNWLDSLLPKKEVEHSGIGAFGGRCRVSMVVITTRTCSASMTTDNHFNLR